jgi:hypothetical protein
VEWEKGKGRRGRRQRKKGKEEAAINFVLF